MTCSLDTVGNPSRKSLMDSPASRYSMSVWTGTLVPRNTGVPPMISGLETTTEVLILTFSRPKWAFLVTAVLSSAVTALTSRLTRALHPTAGHTASSDGDMLSFSASPSFVKPAAGKLIR